jgi:hypothetical protein
LYPTTESSPLHKGRKLDTEPSHFLLGLGRFSGSARHPVTEQFTIGILTLDHTDNRAFEHHTDTI